MQIKLQSRGRIWINASSHTNLKSHSFKQKRLSDPHTTWLASDFVVTNVCTATAATAPPLPAATPKATTTGDASTTEALKTENPATTTTANDKSSKFWKSVFVSFVGLKTVAHSDFKSKLQFVWHCTLCLIQHQIFIQRVLLSMKFKLVKLFSWNKKTESKNCVKDHHWTDQIQTFKDGIVFLWTYSTLSNRLISSRIF